ncbi:MAG TPA: hypothetical protein VJO54_11140 [Burkholderiales bacterium]|nr:hypothetical protein [Burkholderiales bacterium]
MQARVTDRPVEQVIAAIQALDLESVKLRVIDPKLGEGWTRAYADSIEVAYKNYLTMLAKYQDDAEDILLSEDVDEFWHTHILQTIKYTADCEAVFGKYLHHAPHVGEITAADLEKRAAMADRTRNLYEKEFGSGRNRDAAWSGRVDKAGKAAFSGAAVGSAKAAFSGAAIQARQAAFSGAAVTGARAAFSGAAIAGARTAFSGAAIRAEEAAFSGAAIRGDKAAFSGAALRARGEAGTEHPERV